MFVNNIFRISRHSRLPMFCADDMKIHVRVNNLDECRKHQSD